MNAACRGILFAVAVALGGANTLARADLNLTLPDSPDIMAGFIDVTYDAVTNAFQADGFALKLDDDGVGLPETITDGTFHLSATIDESGNALGGALDIGGTINSLGFNSGTLLTGDLTAFNTVGGADPFEFLFTATGGDALNAGLYGATPVGTILSFTGFGGSFAQSFDNLFFGMPGTGGAVADVAPVPLPGSTLLGMVGFAVIGWLKRRSA